MLAQVFGIVSLGLLLYWVFTTSKKRGYSTIESMGWGLLFALLLASRNPLIMIGGIIMYSIVSIKHQIKTKSKALKPLQLCSKCGHESENDLHQCPKCDNQLTV